MRFGVVWMLLSACGTSSPSESFDCSEATYAEPLAAGFTKTADAGKINFSFVELAPTQPESGDNNWTIQLLVPGTGDGIVGAQMTGTTIPHGTHPLGDPVALTPLATPGRFLIVPRLYHAGLWDTTIVVTGATTDTITFVACAAR